MSFNIDEISRYKINESGEEGSPFKEPHYLLPESYISKMLEPKESANQKLGLPRGKMGQVYFAFDIDGTLRNNVVDQTQAAVANERIRTLLIILSSFKNIKILVWSGSGELYARQIAAGLGLSSYVDMYASKSDHEFITSKYTVIAVDDIQDTAIGHVNLIVNEK